MVCISTQYYLSFNQVFRDEWNLSQSFLRCTSGDVIRLPWDVVGSRGTSLASRLLCDGRKMETQWLEISPRSYFWISTRNWLYHWPGWPRKALNTGQPARVTPSVWSSGSNKDHYNWLHLRQVEPRFKWTSSLVWTSLSILQSRGWVIFVFSISI